MRQRRVTVPMTALDPAARTRIRRAYQSIATGGNTNLESGIRLGQEQFDAARRKTHLRRALILSDGEANTGLTDTDGLSSLVHAMARQGVAVSAGGFGLEYNAGLMQALANAGGGNLQQITISRQPGRSASKSRRR